MKRFIELKHVRARDHVRGLLQDLLDRLEHKFGSGPQDAVSVHVMFEENGRHALFRAAVTCRAPGYTVAAHEEQREPGLAIRKAFAELERQLDKRKAVRRHERQVRRSQRTRRSTSKRRPLAPSIDGIAGNGEGKP